jgi:hypothetical protein
MNHTPELDLAAIKARAERAHRMSCSDPDDPNRRTPYSDTLLLAAEVERLRGQIRQVDTALFDDTMALVAQRDEARSERTEFEVEAAEARAETARLRAALNRVSALADEGPMLWNGETYQTWVAVNNLRSVLAPFALKGGE